MQTTFRAKRVETGGKDNPLALTRLIWSGSVDGGDQAAWTRLTDGLERLTAAEVQERFAAEGIQMTLDAASDLKIDAVIQRPGRELAVISLDDEHAISGIEPNNSASLHDSPHVTAAIVAQGGPA